MRRLFLLLFGGLPVVLGLLTGCGSAPAPPAVVPPDVYAVGFETVGNLYKAVIWKNGVLSELDSGNYGARAFAVTAANGHVYVAGFEGSGSGNNVAMLWTDGVPTMLTDGTGIATANGVAVLGTDVYVVGSEATLNPTYGVYVSAAKFWKNGTPTVLSQGSPSSGPFPTPQGAAATAVTTDGTDVYIAGTVNTATQTGPNSYTIEPVVTYWKDGVAKALTDGSEYSQATGVAVASGQVYVSGGLCMTFTPDCQQAELWTGGTGSVLAPGDLSESSGIAVSGNNVYASVNVADVTGNTAYLVTNGKLAPISSTNQSAANCVVTDGADVYVGGADVYGPGYWKNGSMTTLTGATGTASVYAMAVVPGS